MISLKILDRAKGKILRNWNSFYKLSKKIIKDYYTVNIRINIYVPIEAHNLR